MEAKLVPALLARGAEYEPLRLTYPAKPRQYVPDVVLPNGIALEIKGWFKSADRAKLLQVKLAYPALDLRMILASPNQKLNKTSLTTQAAWCDAHGLPWSHKEVPESWITEPTNVASLAVLNAAPRRKHA
jgi:hypothetical protein